MHQLPARMVVRKIPRGSDSINCSLTSVPLREDTKDMHALPSKWLLQSSVSVTMNVTLGRHIRIYCLICIYSDVSAREKTENQFLADDVLRSKVITQRVFPSGRVQKWELADVLGEVDQTIKDVIDNATAWGPVDADMRVGRCLTRSMDGIKQKTVNHQSSQDQLEKRWRQNTNIATAK